MNKVALNFTEGLNILRGYGYKKGSDMTASHDVIYVGLTCRSVSNEDIQRLISLGFYQGFIDNVINPFSVNNYKIEEFWAFDT